MGTYIARRLLLMIPTLIGITFIVFMLVALSPGGIGAVLSGTGGQMEASKAAQIQAYLEDRYGLDSPVFVQYLRWLGRISPLKFGRRDQVLPNGEHIQPPRSIEPPMLWEWFAGSLPRAGPALSPIQPSMDRQQQQTAYRGAEIAYVTARSQFIAARVAMEQALARYAESQGVVNVMSKNRRPDVSKIRPLGRDPSNPKWSEAEQKGVAAVHAYGQLLQARANADAAFSAEPFPKAGIPIIPGAVSLGWPDFGVAFSRGRPAMDLILDALPVTLLLNLIAVPIIYFVAIPTGMLAAARRGTWLDVGIGSLLVALWSIPTVWAGVLCIGYLANNKYLGWFPVSALHDKAADSFPFLPSYDNAGSWQRGYLLDTLWHICLPVFCIVYGGFARLSKQTRAAMLDNYSADFVRTARAKGVPAKDVLFRHVFRNSLIPIITIFVTVFPFMLSGSVVIERIFSIPGMGWLIIEAINLRDRELILANTLMISAVNLLALLAADILYALADPRVSYE